MSEKKTSQPSVLSWVAPSYDQDTMANDERIDWMRSIPYIAMHLMCFAVIWTGVSWPAAAMCAFLYCFRVFLTTAMYHRYFSHRAFKMNRFWQFVFGVLGCTSVQRGPLWWAAHHRHHHAHSDEESDFHSPRQHGFWWSHMGWFLTPKGFRTQWERLPDFKKFPELVWLEKFDLVPPVLLAVGLFFFGVYLGDAYPDLGVTGMQMLTWGFFVSTILVYHATYLVNSLTHVMGSRRYKTKDDSKNSLIIALLTFGEGWHNNHHYYPAAARQGFFWWEIDMSFYILTFLSWIGVVWDLKAVPHKVLVGNREAVIPAEAAKGIV